MTVRALIVDDSPTMRSIVAALLSRDPDVTVIGAAANAADARVMIRELDPDVITLDVEMPQMDGLSFLEKIMRLRPTPVVMVSSLTAKGADATIRALELGAIDCYAKPTGGMTDMLAQDAGRLAAMVKQAASCRTRVTRRTPMMSRPRSFNWNGRMIAIAASTGGVEALSAMLDAFPANCPPTVIVQHMPANFTKMFADRLNRKVAPKVVEAEHGMSVEQGCVYIAPGGSRHLVVGGRGRPICRLVESEPINGHRPSADALFMSLAQAAPESGVGVILTGMGDDGSRGLSAMRSAGFPTIGQSQESALIYGMPRAAAERGALSQVMALERMPARLMELCAC